MKNIITLIATFLIACISFLFNYYLCSIATQIILGFTTSYFIFQFILVLDNLLDKYKIVEEVKEIEKEQIKEEDLVSYDSINMYYKGKYDAIFFNPDKEDIQIHDLIQIEKEEFDYLYNKAVEEVRKSVESLQNKGKNM